MLLGEPSFSSASLEGRTDQDPANWLPKAGWANQSSPLMASQRVRSIWSPAKIQQAKDAGSYHRVYFMTTEVIMNPNAPPHITFKQSGGNVGTKISNALHSRYFNPNLQARTRHTRGAGGVAVATVEEYIPAPVRYDLNSNTLIYATGMNPKDPQFYDFFYPASRLTGPPAAVMYFLKLSGWSVQDIIGSDLTRVSVSFADASSDDQAWRAAVALDAGKVTAVGGPVLATGTINKVYNAVSQLIQQGLIQGVPKIEGGRGAAAASLTAKMIEAIRSPQGKVLVLSSDWPGGNSGTGVTTRVSPNDQKSGRLVSYKHTRGTSRTANEIAGERSGIITAIDTILREGASSDEISRVSNLLTKQRDDLTTLQQQATAGQAGTTFTQFVPQPQLQVIPQQLPQTVFQAPQPPQFVQSTTQGMVLAPQQQLYTQAPLVLSAPPPVFSQLQPMPLPQQLAQPVPLPQQQVNTGPTPVLSSTSPRGPTTPVRPPSGTPLLVPGQPVQTLQPPPLLNIPPVITPGGGGGGAPTQLTVPPPFLTQSLVQQPLSPGRTT